MPATDNSPSRMCFKTAEDWRKAGRQVALATVIETWGSAPTADRLASGDRFRRQFRRLGLRRLRRGRRRRRGCRGDRNRQSPTTLEFGVADETAWRVGLSCGGRIRVYVEPVT